MAAGLNTQQLEAQQPQAPQPQPSSAQSQTVAAPGQVAAPVAAAPAKTGAQPAPATAGQAPGAPTKNAPGDFPFSEDSSVPLLPSGNTPSPDAASAGAGGSSSRQPGNAMAGGANQDQDPVHSPDSSGGSENGSQGASDDGFSSSLTGDDAIKDLVPDANSQRPGKKLAPVKTKEQMLKEDLDAGRLYLDRHNWKGALGRYQSAFALDPEEPEAAWGLAEAERRLNLLAEAREHYQKVVDYDPDSPHGRAARKILESSELQVRVTGTGNAPK